MTTLKVVLIKPSKYGIDGYVERFQSGYIPNATLYHIAGLTPNSIDAVSIETHTVDEYVRTDLDYLNLLHAEKNSGEVTLLALVGVQSHQFHRALDLAAYAKHKGVEHCIIGGPHPMTCDTTQFHNSGISFALAEAEVVWEEVLQDAIAGKLKSVYGSTNRWAMEINGPIVNPPSNDEMNRYLTPLLGLYPVRGCPYDCNYCSVVKISGQQVRSTPIECTLESLQLAKDAGVEFIMFVSDNFNKYPEATSLLNEMINRKLDIPFLCQCDAQIAKQQDFVELLGKAGCNEIFVGVESFDKQTLREANKFHNQPERYKDIIQYCNDANISSHFSNIIGFPNDSKETIYEQLDIIKALNPSIVSFYILTPIPGTEQYLDYKANNLLVEENLDRYDATCLTWSHPEISKEEMSKLMLRCYIDFYTTALKSGNLSQKDRITALAFRQFAKLGMHPMSGGTGKNNIDSIDDYIQLRKQTYGIELAPLPDNLKLSPADEQINKSKNWKIAY